MSAFLAAFRDVARRTPQATALLLINDLFAEAPLTYAEVESHAETLAHSLRALAIQPGEVVALACGRSKEFVIGVLAVWMCEAAFVAVDPQLPPLRREHILRRANACISIDDSLRCERLRSDVAWPHELKLAYICFSSGSSGEPKGIALGHAGLMPMLRAQIDAFAIHPQARALWLYGPSFDASLSDIGTALLSGATLVIHASDLMSDPRSLRQALERHAITHLDVPPSLLPHLALSDVKTLECVVLGGESADVVEIRKLASKTRVVNVYGPTEATVCPSLVRCDEAWTQPTIGLPLPHIRYRIASLEEPHEEADEGELWIGGNALALGYLGDEALTRARFVMHQGERHFRSGDRVRRTTDAQGWAILGRIDRQRKIDGKIVSPEEIERVLRTLLERDVCVVTTHTEPHRLVAFIAPSSTPTDTTGLRLQLRAHLPEHMIPWRFVTHALPRNAHGKVDLQALTADADALVASHDAAASEPYRALLTRFAQGDADATLESLGLSSLDRIELLAALRREGRVVSTAMLQTCTIAELWNAPRAVDEAHTSELLAFIAHLSFTARNTPGTSAPRTLFTGGTGFLGRRWVRALLDSTSRTMVCLVRGPDAEERLFTALGPLSDEQRARIEVLRGDVEQAAFGLEREVYEALTKQVDHVVHLAASMSVVASREDLWNANVLATLRVLAFVREGVTKSLDYASTLAVLASTDRVDSLMEEGDSALEPCRIFGGYAQTKWCAEQLVRRAMQGAHAPIRIHRLGLLVGNHTSSDWLTASLHGLLELGAYPDDLDPELASDITPVAYAARACATLHDAPSGVFHLRGRTVRFRELIASLARSGVPLACVSRASFRNLLVAHPSPATAALQLAMERDALQQGGFDLFLATRRVFSMTHTQAALRARGIADLDVTDREIESLLRDIVATHAKEARS